MISQIQAAVAAVVSNKTPTIGSVADREPQAVGEPAKMIADKTTFSTLAAQLNESGARAEKRDAGMTHAELGRYGRTRINEFLIEAREANSGTRAMEVPKTNDPELLDRAREASAYVTRTLAGDKNARSPFENFPRATEFDHLRRQWSLHAQRAACSLAGRAEDGRPLALSGNRRGRDGASPDR